MTRCITGCSDRERGHQLTRIQLHTSAAAKSGWQDGFLTRFLDDGWFTLDLFDGDEVLCWNHGALPATFIVGAPVALHPTYGVLAGGRERVSVKTVIV